MTVTDEMVERAWAAIVGADVSGICFQASIIRADLRTALEALAVPAQGAREALERIRDFPHRGDPSAQGMVHLAIQGLAALADTVTDTAQGQPEITKGVRRK